MLDSPTNIPPAEPCPDCGFTDPDPTIVASHRDTWAQFVAFVRSGRSLRHPAEWAARPGAPAPLTESELRLMDGNR